MFHAQQRQEAGCRVGGSGGVPGVQSFGGMSVSLPLEALSVSLFCPQPGPPGLVHLQVDLTYKGCVFRQTCLHWLMLP